ncbi:winged helix-turn-helix transcriptional regulator [Komagataeibacter oboediens]|uniref:winged helix-turn-helix transcriptional regulator n=1 Tax=Komagataeibacter oboediens TaxID=65958 RepID=UPI000237F07D|nr:helix-turn-helix domain-containing protein [Komagataeibacter oboediens]
MPRIRHTTLAWSPGCTVEATLELFGGKWKALILYHLFEDGVLRFGELRRRLPNVTQRMLTNQLRELEADGLVSRTVFPEVPPHVDYALTELGKTLKPVIQALNADFFCGCRPLCKSFLTHIDV